MTERTRRTGARTTPPTPAAGREAVDAFLATLPDDTRAALQRLRELIAAAAPEAVETIAYGVPAFKYRARPFVSYGAGKAGKGHCAFYVQSPAVMEAHRDELKGYETSAGTIRFQPSEPLPGELVRKLVRARMAETDGAPKR